MNVAKYDETTSRLNTRADIGLYHDIALYLRMPIILSNDRKLSDLNGSASVQNIGSWVGPARSRRAALQPSRSRLRSAAASNTWRSASTSAS